MRPNSRLGSLVANGFALLVSTITLLGCQESRQPLELTSSEDWQKTKSSTPVLVPSRYAFCEEPDIELKPPIGEIHVDRSFLPSHYAVISDDFCLLRGLPAPSSSNKTGQKNSFLDRFPENLFFGQDHMSGEDFFNWIQSGTSILMDRDEIESQKKNEDVIAFQYSVISFLHEFLEKRNKYFFFDQVGWVPLKSPMNGIIIFSRKYFLDPSFHNYDPNPLESLKPDERAVLESIFRLSVVIHERKHVETFCDKEPEGETYSNPKNFFDHLKEGEFPDQYVNGAYGSEIAFLEWAENAYAQFSPQAKALLHHEKEKDFRKILKNENGNVQIFNPVEEKRPFPIQKKFELIPADQPPPTN